ncbi:MAG: sensor histidine kinase, partial [Burkholderiales bacterium]
MHNHDLGLVILSFVIAALASFCSLDMAERMRASEGRSRMFWLVMAGITLGGGIWSMHFIGMTAFQSPIEEGYDPGLTLLSG